MARKIVCKGCRIMKEVLRGCIKILGILSSCQKHVGTCLHGAQRKMWLKCTWVAPSTSHTLRSTLHGPEKGLGFRVYGSGFRV